VEVIEGDTLRQHGAVAATVALVPLVLLDEGADHIQHFTF
jgi:hypothetical protein